MIKKFLRKKITRPELDRFICKYSSNSYTLDLGSGNSPYSHFFKNRLGLDTFKGRGVDVVGDAHDIPFEDEKFEVILCSEVLEHLQDPQKAILEMKRVLKKGGILILTTRFVFPIHDAPGDYYRYTKYGLKHLFRDWKIVEFREEVGVPKTIAILFQEIALQKKMSKNFLIKGLLLLSVKFIVFYSFLVENIFKKNKTDSFLTSGYYLICKKI